MHTEKPCAPEKLSLWDRLFNRYRREVHGRGQEKWGSTPTCNGLPIGEPRLYFRDWVEHRTVDRLTGSYTIKRDYLN